MMSRAKLVLPVPEGPQYQQRQLGTGRSSACYRAARFGVGRDEELRGCRLRVVLIARPLKTGQDCGHVRAELPLAKKSSQPASWAFNVRICVIA